MIHLREMPLLVRLLIISTSGIIASICATKVITTHLLSIPSATVPSAVAHAHVHPVHAYALSPKASEHSLGHGHRVHPHARHAHHAKAVPVSVLHAGHAIHHHGIEATRAPVDTCKGRLVLVESKVAVELCVVCTTAPVCILLFALGILGAIILLLSVLIFAFFGAWLRSLRSLVS
ncbi:hypothetical protein BKA80DRAFT_263049 [Phyllosticta citrichinensis]